MTRLDAATDQARRFREAKARHAALAEQVASLKQRAKDLRAEITARQKELAQAIAEQDAAAEAAAEALLEDGEELPPAADLDASRLEVAVHEPASNDGNAEPVCPGCWQSVAAELTASAVARSISARAEVHGDRLVLSGAAFGARALALATTTPARARQLWDVYLTTCAHAPAPRFGLGVLRRHP